MEKVFDLVFWMALVAVGYTLGESRCTNTETSEVVQTLELTLPRGVDPKRLGKPYQQTCYTYKYDDNTRNQHSYCIRNGNAKPH